MNSRSATRTRSFQPSPAVGFGPRSKEQLRQLSDNELVAYAEALGIRPSVGRAAVIRAVEEAGVAYMASSSQKNKSDAPSVPAEANVDVDAQPIADSTLRTLPPQHPGWNTPAADASALRAPDEVDIRPTVDHRPQPDSNLDPEEISESFPSQAEVMAAPMDESSIHGKTREEITGESVSPDEGGEDDEEEELSGQALQDRAKELDIEGRSSMTADELRAAIRDAEAE